jgi:peptide/nickel transport system permease protein
VFADLAVGARRTWANLPLAPRAALAIIALLYAVALVTPLVAPHSPSHQFDIVALKNQAPSWQHPFGTDAYSRDLLTRVLYGARVSLAVATIAMLMSAVVGTAYGLVSATAGGAVDSVMMRLLDALLSIPRVLLLIAVLALFNPMPLPALVAVLGLTGWFDVSRLVRAEALSLRERDYVAAARSLGAGTARVMLRHLLPNVLVPVIVVTTLGVANIIVIEAGLSFLGIGAQEPVPSWGTLFYQGTEAFVGTWWAALFPGVAIVTTVLCFNILGDALRRILDPRHLRGA